MTNHCKDPNVEVAKETFKYLTKNKSQAEKLTNAISKAIVNISYGLRYGLALAVAVSAIYIIKKYFNL